VSRAIHFAYYESYPEFHDGEARGSHRVTSTDRDHSIYRPEMIDRREIAYSNAKVVLNIEIVEFKNKIRRNEKGEGMEGRIQ